MDNSDYGRFMAILKHFLFYNYPYSVFKKRINQATDLEAKNAILRQLEFYRTRPLVEIIAFCLMSNHFHLILKQLEENGITRFMHRIGTGYTNYFNIKNERSGRLFEGTYKSVLVESDEQLFHLSRYIHLNPTADKLISLEDLPAYPWSSLPLYLGKGKLDFIKPNIILNNFKESNSYWEFLKARVDENEIFKLQEVAADDDFGWFAEFQTLKTTRKKESLDRYYRLSRA